MSSGSTQYFEVDYPCWRWYLWLVWFYIFLPIMVISVAYWIKGGFSVISCVVLVLFLQLLWLPRLIKDIWVPYAVSIEEDRVVVYTRVGKRIKENPIELKNLGVKYFKRRKALTLWEREENRIPPPKMFYLSKNTNWSASSIEVVKHSLLSIAHYPVHYEEVQSQTALSTDNDYYLGNRLLSSVPHLYIIPANSFRRYDHLLLPSSWFEGPRKQPREDKNGEILITSISAIQRLDHRIKKPPQIGRFFDGIQGFPLLPSSFGTILFNSSSTLCANLSNFRRSSKKFESLSVQSTKQDISSEVSFFRAQAIVALVF